jgi:glycosyltransferase involved in cell wall biosynthesis
MINILFITDKLNEVCGVSNYLKSLINGLNCLGNKYQIYLLCGSVENSELIKEYNCKVFVNNLFLHRNRSYYNYLLAVLYLLKFITKYKIKIIHSQNHYAANIAFNTAKFFNVKTIQTNHGIIPEVGRLKHYKADYHIVLDQKIYHYYTDILRIPSSKLKIIFQGVQATNYTKQKKNNKKFIFFAASRFVKEKGLDIYIKASNILGKARTGLFEFNISGKGDEEFNLRTLNKELGDKVSFVDRNNYIENLKKSNCFIFTSISEGSPIVLLEAIFYSGSVISSKYFGVNEIFTPEFDDCLFEVGDADSLIDKMLYVYNNYKVIENKFNILNDKIKNKYSIKSMIDEHNILYKTI